MNGKDRNTTIVLKGISLAGTGYLLTGFLYAFIHVVIDVIQNNGKDWFLILFIGGFVALFAKLMHRAFKMKIPSAKQQTIISDPLSVIDDNIEISDNVKIDVNNNEITDFYVRELPLDSPFSMEMEILKRVKGRQTNDAKTPVMYDFTNKPQMIINKLVEQNLLTISRGYDCLEYLTIPQLKDILRKHSLKLSGVKKMLIERITENILENELASLCEMYVLTPKGKEVMASYTLKIEQAFNETLVEMTKLISTRRIRNAYDLYIRYENGNPLRINYETTYYMLSDKPTETIKTYGVTDNFTEQTNLLFLGYLDNSPLDDMTKGAILSCYMFGMSCTKAANKLSYLANHLFLSCGNNCNTDFISKEFHRISGARDFLLYKSASLSKYMFITSEEDMSHPECQALNNKIFNTDEAIIGENYPPMHDKCKCIVIPHFDDEV